MSAVSTDARHYYAATRSHRAQSVEAERDGCTTVFDLMRQLGTVNSCTDEAKRISNELQQYLARADCFEAAVSLPQPLQHSSESTKKVLSNPTSSRTTLEQKHHQSPATMQLPTARLVSEKSVSVRMECEPQPSGKACAGSAAAALQNNNFSKMVYQQQPNALLPTPTLPAHSALLSTPKELAANDAELYRTECMLASKIKQLETSLSEIGETCTDAHARNLDRQLTDSAPAKCFSAASVEKSGGRFDSGTSSSNSLRPAKLLESAKQPLLVHSSRQAAKSVCEGQQVAAEKDKESGLFVANPCIRTTFGASLPASHMQHAQTVDEFDFVLFDYMESASTSTREPAVFDRDMFDEAKAAAAADARERAVREGAVQHVCKPEPTLPATASSDDAVLPASGTAMEKVQASTDDYCLQRTTKTLSPPPPPPAVFRPSPVLVMRKTTIAADIPKFASANVLDTAAILRNIRANLDTQPTPLPPLRGPPPPPPMSPRRQSSCGRKDYVGSRPRPLMARGVVRSGFSSRPHRGRNIVPRNDDVLYRSKVRGPRPFACRENSASSSRRRAEATGSTSDSGDSDRSTSRQRRKKNPRRFSTSSCSSLSPDRASRHSLASQTEKNSTAEEKPFVPQKQLKTKSVCCKFLLTAPMNNVQLLREECIANGCNYDHPAHVRPADILASFHVFVCRSDLACTKPDCRRLHMDKADWSVYRSTQRLPFKVLFEMERNSLVRGNGRTLPKRVTNICPYHLVPSYGCRSGKRCKHVHLKEPHRLSTLYIYLKLMNCKFGPAGCKHYRRWQQLPEQRRRDEVDDCEFLHLTAEDEQLYVRFGHISPHVVLEASRKKFFSQEPNWREMYGKALDE